jgi:hypothetical protein
MKRRVTPTVCPHCTKYVYSPPGWIAVLLALSPTLSKRYDKTGMKWGTQFQIANALCIPEKQVKLDIRMCLVNGVITPANKNGEYHTSMYGKQLLQMWLRAGWKPGDKKVGQAESRERSVRHACDERKITTC